MKKTFTFILLLTQLSVHAQSSINRQTAPNEGRRIIGAYGETEIGSGQHASTPQFRQAMKKSEEMAMNRCGCGTSIMSDCVIRVSNWITNERTDRWSGRTWATASANFQCLLSF